MPILVNGNSFLPPTEFPFLPISRSLPSIFSPISTVDLNSISEHLAMLWIGLIVVIVYSISWTVEVVTCFVCRRWRRASMRSIGFLKWFNEVMMDSK